MDGNLAFKPKTPEAAQAKSDLRERVQSLRLPDGAELDSPARRWLGRLVWIAVAAAIGVVGCLAYSAMAPQDEPSAAPAVAKGTTESTTGQPQQPRGTAPVALSGEIAHESKGYIIPAHQILISPQVAGVIIKLNVEEGQRVEKGELIAKIDSTEYDADFLRAQANVAAKQQRLLELERGNRTEEIEQAKAELQEAQAQRTQLSAEWQRVSQLRRAGVATQSEYDIAEADFKANDRKVERLQKAYDLMVAGPRVERIEESRADLALAKAEMSKARWKLDNCEIRAPIAGTILMKNAEEGNLVNPLVQHGSYSLCEMADLSDLEVDLSIQERDVSKIFKGQRCKVRAEAWPNRVYEGVVSRLMPIADRAKGAVPVRVKVDVPAEEEGVYLKPEMGAVVSFLNNDTAPEPEADRADAG